MKRLLTAILCSLLLSGGAFAQEEQEIIEHFGDRYVIHVDALNPDREMTLMDVLQTCPELMSANGKQLSSDFEIRVDNIVLTMDDETILEALKASEINTVEVYMYSPVDTGGAGRCGVIDIYFKEQEDGATRGKLLLEGSTRGNGKAYADVITRTGNVTFRAHALSNLGYARGTLSDYDWYSLRKGIENVHLNIDWNISERDNLKIKLTQNFLDYKERIRVEQGTIQSMPELQRYWGGVASYTHTLNDAGATVLAEGGVEYQNLSFEESRQRDCYAYYFTETSIPLNDDLALLAGWEIDYDNAWTEDYDRQQTMFNDLYLQFDYTKGPWVLALGDRFRIINYWHRTFNTDDTSLWNNNRTEHSFLASAGYKTGGHFVQGLFVRDYFTPSVYDLYAGYDETSRRRTYITGYQTKMAYCAEARYTYQQPDLVVSGSVLHSWESNSLLYNEQYTGVRASATWRKGPLRLTAGADYFHGYVSGSDFDIDKHNNFFHLRLQPTLLLNGGLRISSRLLYNSRQDLLFEQPAHLYASLKVSKELGRHLTLSADFHDIAGSPQVSYLQLGSSCDNRALTFGLIYRF
jgi:hypothetical protein